jgi:hypothetical protein
LFELDGVGKLFTLLEQIHDEQSVKEMSHQQKYEQWKLLYPKE